MNNYLKVLWEIYSEPRFLQSDHARYNAKFIAEAASRGHITSIIGGVATNKWYITVGGMLILNEAGCVD